MARPPPERDKESDLTKRERQILSQLRCNGKSPILRNYLFDIGKADDNICPRCQQEPDTLSHILWKCPAGDRFRSLLSNDREVLWSSPGRVMEYLHGSGVMPPSIDASQ